MTEDQEILINNHIKVNNRDAAMSLIMSTYGRRLLYFIKQLVLIQEDAQDVYQDVLILVYNNLNKFKQESKIYTWIYKIAMRESIRFVNNKKKKHSYNEWNEEYNNVYKSYLNSDTEEKTWQRLYKAIHTLPEKQKTVFILRYFEELPYSEISKITDSSEGTLKTNYHFAVEKIKKIVENENKYI